MEKEAQLVSNVLNGDLKSFEVLMSMYRNRIYNFLYKMTLSREDSEDMAQEVFVRVYNNLYQYNSKWCFSTWIFKIAVNVFKTEYQKKKARESKNSQYILNSSINSAATDPERVLENMETKLEVLKIKVMRAKKSLVKSYSGFKGGIIREML